MSDATTDLTPQQKRELLAKLLAAKQGREPQSHPLSYNQRALWFLYHLDPGSTAYNVMCAAHVRSDVDVEALRRAFETVLARHPALRTTYANHDGAPVQIVHAQMDCELDVVDAAALDDEEFEQEMLRSADDPFDLELGPVIRLQLFRRGNQPQVLLVTAHHIALDFWSVDILLEELDACYRQETSGTPARLAELPIEYSDFARWQHEMLASPDGESHLQYWQQELAGELPTLEVPADRPRPAVQSFDGQSFQFRLSSTLSRDVLRLAKDQGVTPNVVLLAAFQLLLARYSGQDDILVGTPAAGRGRPELEGLIGYFLNPIVVRSQLPPDSTFADLLKHVRTKVAEGVAHQDYPFALLVEKLRLPRDASRSPVFQASFSWDRPRKWAGRAESNGTAAAGLGLEPFALAQRGAAFDLTLMMLHLGDALSGVLQYNTDLFDEASARRMAEHLQLILQEVATDPGQRCCELSLLTPKEKLLLSTWNDTAADYPRDACLHQLFEQQATETPDAPAIVHGDEALTYCQLDERANQLAAYLQHRGVGPDVLVGIHLDRSPDMLVSMLGVLKAGGAYVPLDPAAPPQRLAYMLAQSRAPLVLTDRQLAEAVGGTDAEVICIDEEWEAIRSAGHSGPGNRATATDLAYVIFTSGSTGKPKGVQIEHRAVVNFLKSMQREPGISADDTLLAVTTFSFDISVLELFLPLAVGAKIVLVDRTTSADGTALVQLLAESGSTIMQATPATWRLLIRAGWEGDASLKVLCGGEELPRDLANELVARCGSLWNMYGPTETTIWSAVDRVESGHGPVSLGRPIANTQIVILDGSLNPLPPGVPGDLYIGGDGLARGYLNRPELNAERFILRSFDDGEPVRLYKTGDVARFRADGRLEYLGRADFQVKVQGHRIELSEIEAVLTDHDAVHQAVVVARQTGSCAVDKQLVGYYVPASDSSPSHSELRTFALQRLPAYMVPATFLELEAFPLNPAGKVDRKALPEPGSARPQLDAKFVAPRNDVERALAEVWSDVLDIEKVGIHDHFLELGGASIQSLEVASRATDAGYHITPAMLFQYPTIAELAAACVPAAAESDTLVADSDADAQPTAAAVAAQSVAAPSTAAAQPAEPATDKQNILIESLGIYLPPDTLTTKQVLEGCQHKVWFPLGKMTGIETRHVAGEKEFSIDLAVKATQECLATSRHTVEDIELVVCCNITRGDAPDELSLDPNTALQLKARLGFPNAVVLDATNACAGMFTAIKIVEAYLRTGAIKVGMVVSGEYISGITKTAQREINGFFDPRLACLTVGDAGAAIVLETTDNHGVGFHELELYTLSEYSEMCIGTISKEPQGGPILLVPDPIAHTSVAVEHSVKHAQRIFDRSPWKTEEMQHLIMHQTSDRSLRDGMRAINKAFKRKICRADNTINNLAHRGNTACTSHFVAVWDNILSGRIRSGDKAVFGITGSGQTIGTGVYTFDDLPDRIRQRQEANTNGAPSSKPSSKLSVVARPANDRPVGHGRIRIRSAATLPIDDATGRNTVHVTTAAAEACLAQSPYDRRDIDLLIFAGMTRSDYISEPAIATLIGGEMKMNHLVDVDDPQKTLAFDVYNGALGFFNACQVAGNMIATGEYENAMIVASELQVNRENFPEEPVDWAEVASAMILDRTSAEREGFGSFAFGYDTEHAAARVTAGLYRDGKPYCRHYQDPRISGYYLDLIESTVQRLLEQESLSPSDFRVVLQPQFSADFNNELAARLGIERQKLIDMNYNGDLFTSTLPCAYLQAVEGGRANSGDVGLIINVAAGLQVGCAIYYF